MSHKFLLYAPMVNVVASGATPNKAIMDHWETNLKQHKQGIIHLGGGMYTPETMTAELTEKKLVATVIIYNGDSLESVRKIVESDALYTSGSWDKEKLVLLPFSEAPYSQF